MRRQPPLEPEHFGWQLNDTYIPGPDEIAQRCAELRQLWSSRETRKRAGWAENLHGSTPVVGADIRMNKALDGL